MILVDTSVWIDYFRGRRNAASLQELLDDNQILFHPWIYGELMLGYLGPKRKTVLTDLNLLPKLPVCPMDELDNFVETEKLHSKGLSLVDVQLLYASIVADCFLWTHDRQLIRFAETYGRAYQTPR